MAHPCHKFLLKLAQLRSKLLALLKKVLVSARQILLNFAQFCSKLLAILKKVLVRARQILLSFAQFRSILLKIVQKSIGESGKSCSILLNFAQNCSQY